MNNRDYTEFSETLHQIKDNLVAKRKNLYAALDQFQKNRPLSPEANNGDELSAPYTWRDFIDVSCTPENSDGPVLVCGYPDIDGDIIKRVSPLMLENGKQRILKVYKFAFEILNEQITEVEEEIIRLQSTIKT